MVSILFTPSTAREKVSLKLNNKPVSQVETPTFLGGTHKTNKNKHKLKEQATEMLIFRRQFQGGAERIPPSVGHSGGAFQISELKF